MALGYVLSFLSWIAGYLAILFEVVSIACGLYYAAELAEEYSKMARRIISVAIGVVVAVHLLLLLEDLPWWLLLFGVGCHCIYFLLLTDFPNVQVFSLKCFGSLVAVLADHFLWFRYFRTVRFEVAHTLAIFMLLVWLVPFALFVTLTTSDMSLPLSTRSSCSASSPSIQGMPTPRTKHRKAGGLRGLLDGLNAHILPGTTKRV